MTRRLPDRPPYQKFTSEELMGLVDLFGVSAEGQEAIRAILERESAPPNAWLFRYYGQQSKVAQLEQTFAQRMGSRFALGVNSATSALIASLVAAGAGPGDEVIVPAYTFFASASAIVIAKAIPIITEIDETLGLDPEAVEANITERTKAIIAVHMNGYPARIDALRRIADAHSLTLIEDVAQATGGTFNGKPLGSWGHLGCFSFDAYKLIGCGEGGMILTDDEWMYTRAQSYHDTAACWRPDRYASERTPGELFCGENYRMSELSAAVALPQIDKLDAILSASRRTWKHLREAIALPPGCRWIDGADPDGVCGYRLGILFDSVDTAQRVMSAQTGIRGVAAGGTDGSRDWHCYWYWEHILDQKTPTPEGCPFRCPHVKTLPQYSADMCPRTKDIVLRSGFIPILPTDTPEWAAEYAGYLNEVLAEC